MKKLLLIATFTFVGVAAFASNKKPGAVKKVSAKKEILKPMKGNNYPVTVGLSCGVTFVFQSNCTESWYSCIQQWNTEIGMAEGMMCNQGCSC